MKIKEGFASERNRARVKKSEIGPKVRANFFAELTFGLRLT